MIPFFGISEADLAAWRSAMNLPQEMPPIPNPIVNCEICETPIDFGETYVECEPVPPGQHKRTFHDTCLTMHLIRNEDNPNDEITLFVTRKPVCQPETQTNSGLNANDTETIDGLTQFDI